MSLLIKNATIWEWITPAAELTPTSCAYRIVQKRWVGVRKDGRFIIPDGDSSAISSDLPNESEYTACIDASGKLILPGLMDAHIHTSMTGESMHFIDLSHCSSIQQLVDTLEAHIRSRKDSSWVIGVNWDQVCEE